MRIGSRRCSGGEAYAIEDAPHPSSARPFLKEPQKIFVINIGRPTTRVDIDQTMIFLLELLTGTDLDWHTLARTLPVGESDDVEDCAVAAAPTSGGTRDRQPERRSGGVRRVAWLRCFAAPSALGENTRPRHLPRHRASSTFAACSGAGRTPLSASWEYRRPVDGRPSLAAQRTKADTWSPPT